MGLEEKYDEVQKLIDIGKEKGYLLYDEVSDLLPADLTASPEDLEELFAAFGAAGIDLVDSEKAYHARDGMEREEVAEALGISRRTVTRKLERFLGNARKFLARSEP